MLGREETGQWKVIVPVIIIALIVGGAIAWFAKPAKKVVKKKKAKKKKLTPVSIALDWIPMGIHAGWYVADYKGFYENRGLRITSIERGFGSGDTCKKVATGVVDFGYADMGSLIVSRTKGMKVKELGMIMGINPHGFLTIEETGITEPKDLEGASVAMTPGYATYVIREAFGDATGIDMDKINWVSMSPEAFLSSVIAGDVDAMLSYKSDRAHEFGTVLKAGKTPVTIDYYDYGVNIYGNGLIARESWIKNKPELVRAYVEGTMKGWEWAFAHKEKAADIVLEYLPDLPKDQVLGSIDIAENMIKTDEAMEHYLGYMSEKRTQTTIDVIASAYDLAAENVPTVDDVRTNEFLPHIKPTTPTFPYWPPEELK